MDVDQVWIMSGQCMGNPWIKYGSDIHVLSTLFPRLTFYGSTAKGLASLFVVNLLHGQFAKLPRYSRCSNATCDIATDVEESLDMLTY